MIQFSCVCGWSVTARPEMAGRRIRCPGCRQEVDVPKPVVRPAPPPAAAPVVAPAPALKTSEARPPRTAPSVPAPNPWKLVSSVAGAAAIVLLGLLLFRSPSAPAQAADPGRETEVARLTDELGKRERELSELRSKLGSFGEAAFLEGKLEGLEGERDGLRRDLEAAQFEVMDLREKLAVLQNAAPRETAPKEPLTELTDGTRLAAPATFADLVERCSPSVVLVTTDRGIGAGFFVSADGFVVSNYHVIERSRTIQISYIPSSPKGSAKRRIVASARAWAIDVRNDLALLKADVPEPSLPVEYETEVLRPGDEVIAIGNPAIGSVVLEHSVSNGIISNVTREIAGTLFLQTTAAINPGNSGGPLLSRRGRLVGIVTAKARNVENIGFAIPAKAAADLYGGREGPMKLGVPLPDWERNRKFDRPGNPDGIPVGGFITEMILDEDNDRIIALDGISGTVLVVSISQRKVLKEILAGPGTHDLQPSGVMPSLVWVSNRNARTFSKIDLSRGKITAKIDVEFRPGDFLVVNDWIWSYGGGVHVVSISEGKSWLTPAPLSVLAYDRANDTIVGAGTNNIVWEFDSSKMVGTIRELIRLPKNAHPAEREKLVNRLRSLVKVHNLPRDFVQTITSDLSMVAEPRKNLLFFNRVILKLSDPSKVVGVLKSNPHSRSEDPRVRQFIQLNRFLDLIIASSRNGKWVANGTHIFSVETLAAAKELPVPTSVAAFSKDSKKLWLFDAVDGMIVPFPVE